MYLYVQSHNFYYELTLSLKVKQIISQEEYDNLVGNFSQAKYLKNGGECVAKKEGTDNDYTMDFYVDAKLTSDGDFKVIFSIQLSTMQRVILFET